MISVFYMGSPGSGKTTHSKVWTHVQSFNGDAIMESWLKVRKLLRWPFFTKLIYPYAEKAARKRIESAIQLGESFVSDDTSIDLAWTQYAMKKAKEAGFVVYLIYVHTSLETCLDRNKQRNRFVDPRRILEIHQEMEKVWSILSPFADLSVYIKSS